MKSLIKKFAENVLAQEQLRSIKGGAVYCTYTTYGYSTGGYCSVSNTSTCNLYCSNSGFSNCNCQAGY
jgi:natural product precursor